MTAKPIRLRPQTIRIDAPRELVFQMMSHFGRGRLPGDSSESSCVVCREGDRLVAEFRTRAGFFTYTTLEEVMLHPPERIEFRHLEGPLAYAAEEFVFRAVAERLTELTHSGEFVWSGFPLFGRLGGLIYTRPVFERAIAAHMAQVKSAAEARAARSRVFPRE